MRSVLLVLLLLGLGAGYAAGQTQEELKDRYEKKLQKEFIKKVPWMRNLEEVREKAKEQGKLILGYFTRSYAP